MIVVVGTIFLVALVVGVPIAFAMGLAGSTWIMFFEGLDPSVVVRRMYGIMGSFPLLAIPLFSMIGILAERCGMLPDLVKLLQMLLGRLKGGMAYINVANSLMMGGVSGTAVSDVASLGRVEIQMMKRAGYPAAYAAALTASTAVISPIIPPSVAFIIYGLAAGGVSIGGLFMAGVIPGVLMGLGLWAMAWFKSRKAGFGTLVDRPRPSVIFAQALRVIPFMLLPVIIVGGIIGGVFTVTESAAVGVLYVVIVGFLFTRTLRVKDILDSIIYSAIISSVVGMLMGAGAIVSWIITRNQVTQQLAELLVMITSDPSMFMALVAITLLLLGTVMDATALIIMFAPLMVPIARQYGVPDIQFGVVFVMSCMIGMVTPPTGILLFMTSAFAKVPIEQVFKAILPFVFAAMALIGMLILFPALTLYVPSLLGLG